MIRSVVLTVAFAFFASLQGFAEDKPAPKDSPTKPKVYDQVVAVDKTSITVYRGPNKEATFKVTDATKVVVDYKPATIADVKVGMKATVSHKSESEEASLITSQTVRTGRY